jgi:hypothetical protein
MPHGCNEDVEELLVKLMVHTDTVHPDVDDDDVPLVMHRLPNPDRSGIDAISTLSKNVI